MRAHGPAARRRGHGPHTVTAAPLGPRSALLRHVLDATGTGPERPTVVSPLVRLLRRAQQPPARACAVPDSTLLAAALPRVDHVDAYAVERCPGTPADPLVWADATFHDPPAWVVALLGVRERIVGTVGIERGGPRAFDVVAATDDEVLLGSDAGHLDFRVSVRCEPERVVVSTVVQLHNARGRAYFAIVRLVHPVIVAAMLTKAAATLSRSSGPRPAPPAMMGT